MIVTLISFSMHFFFFFCFCGLLCSASLTVCFFCLSFLIFECFCGLFKFYFVEYFEHFISVKGLGKMCLCFIWPLLVLKFMKSSLFSSASDYNLKVIQDCTATTNIKCVCEDGFRCTEWASDLQNCKVCEKIQYKTTTGKCWAVQSVKSAILQWAGLD